MVITRQDCVYTACYCEENIWKLCELIRNRDQLSQGLFYVVFISNSQRRIPIWKQRAGDQDEDGLVFWDYHVILVHFVDDNSLVYDFDTTLDFPCSFDEYVSSAIRSDEELYEDYHRKFRAINVDSYLNHFSSDRSHMKKGNGFWMMPPPSYPCIKSFISENNLESYISMNDDDNEIYGRVVNTKEFCNKEFKL